MNHPHACRACGQTTYERRTVTHDGTVIWANVCDCGHVESFSLNFSASAARPEVSSQRLGDGPRTGPSPFLDRAEGIRT
jgi:hypothetical protein